MKGRKLLPVPNQRNNFSILFSRIYLRPWERICRPKIHAVWPIIAQRQSKVNPRAIQGQSKPTLHPSKHISIYLSRLSSFSFLRVFHFWKIYFDAAVNWNLWMPIVVPRYSERAKSSKHGLPNPSNTKPNINQAHGPTLHYSPKCASKFFFGPNPPKV